MGVRKKRFGAEPYELILEKLKNISKETYDHSLNVANFCLLFGQRLGLNQEDLTKLVLGGLLHDIGKPFSYQDEEVRHFRNHAKVSANISKEILHRLGFNDDYIKYILGIQ